MARKNYKGKSRGRQKIQMVKMENESNLQVTFSKRRTGLFKKASELCTLCAAEVAIIVFSPGQKVFSFGHPCVESVIDRFLTNDPQPVTGAQQFIDAHRQTTLKELNSHFIQMEDVVDALKKTRGCMEEMMETRRSQRWWESSSEKLCMEQLREMLTGLGLLKDNLSNYADRRNLIEAAMSFVNTNNITISGSGSRGFSIRALGSKTNTSMVPYDARTRGSRVFVSYDARTSGSSGTMVPFDARTIGSRGTLLPFNTTRPSGSSSAFARTTALGSESGFPFDFGAIGSKDDMIIPTNFCASGSGFGVPSPLNFVLSGSGVNVPLDFGANSGSNDDFILPRPNISGSMSDGGVPLDFGASNASNIWVGSGDSSVPSNLMANNSTNIAQYNLNASGPNSNVVSFGGNNPNAFNVGGLFDMYNTNIGSTSSITPGGGGVNEFNGGVPLDIISASGFIGGGGGDGDGSATRTNAYFNGGDAMFNGDGGGGSNEIGMGSGSSGGAMIEGGTSGSNEEVPFDDIAIGLSGSHNLHGFDHDGDFFMMPHDQN